jgi:hypothetical protein
MKDLEIIAIDDRDKIETSCEREMKIEKDDEARDESSETRKQKRDAMTKARIISRVI